MVTVQLMTTIQLTEEELELILSVAQDLVWEVGTRGHNEWRHYTDEERVEAEEEAEKLRILLRDKFGKTVP